MSPLTAVSNVEFVDYNVSNSNEFVDRSKILISAVGNGVERLKSEFSKTNLETSFDASISKKYFKIPSERDLKSTIDYENYISKSQNWIGFITELGDLEFTAKLIDKNDNTTFEMGSFKYDNVSPGDRHLLKIGAIFYWSIAYANVKGQVTWQSLMRFKRSIDFSIQDVDNITDRAQVLNSEIHWE